MTIEAPRPLRIFCSYSRKDEEYANDLRDSLRGLERQGLIEWWHDREIVPGWEWEEAIDKHLRTADIVLLVVSRAFMASDYVYEREIGVAVERHDRGEARVIPVIVRPADWEWASFGKLQALPKDAKPITRWPDPDDAWLDVVQGVRRAVGELLVERRELAVKERYREAVEDVWTDHKVSSEEAERLDELAGELGVRTDTAADIEREVMGEIKEELVRREEPSNNQKAALLCKQGLQYLDDKEWTQALQAFDKVCQLQPDFAEAWNNKGLALRNLGRSREALEAYEKAISLKPDLTVAQNNRDIALRDLRKSRQSKGFLRRLIEG
jgi:tetratricopeptide (TPR) repeat protein